MKNIAIALTLLTASCSSMNETEKLSDQDLKEVHDLHQNYRDYWLENDSSKVVSLFSEDAALIPPGNPGNFIRGKKAIGQWWFATSDDTTYPIRGFEYSSDSLIIKDSKTAIWEGVSRLSWQTVVGDSVVSSTESSSNFITICLKTDNGWKIFRQIWNVRPGK